MQHVAKIFCRETLIWRLSKDIATEFAGRGDEVHMYPLSFAEFMTIYSGDKYMGLSEYMLYGGIPLVVLREGANDKAVALQNLFNEIYLQDITKRNRVRNIEELEDLLNILSSAIGSLTNPEKLKNTFKTVKNTGIAVILDCGEFNEIHPKNKVPVGHRLYLQAMHHVYGDNETEAFGPIYKNMIVTGDRAVISFDHAESGFDIKGDNGITGFEIAGTDKEYKPACAVIDEDGTISVYADEVKKPAYVRYLWTNYGDVTLYGKNGIPVAPFRTSMNDEK